MTEADFDQLPAGSQMVLLDVRDREPFRTAHRPNAVNIPIEEIIPRALYELSRDRPLVIHCTPAPRSPCDIAAHFLHDAGFTQVSLLRR